MQADDKKWDEREDGGDVKPGDDGEARLHHATDGNERKMKGSSAKIEVKYNRTPLHELHSGNGKASSAKIEVK